MRTFKKSTKGMVALTITIFTVILTGWTALGSYFPDNPIMQFFVVEAPSIVIEEPIITFTTIKQDPFTILQVFEENSLSQERIESIQFTILSDSGTLPDSGTVILTGQKHIQSVWEILSEVEVTTQGAEQAHINEEKSIYIDFQFKEPNYCLGIEMFGLVYILGRGHFVFADGYSEQPFIDLFNEFATPSITNESEISTIDAETNKPYK